MPYLFCKRLGVNFLIKRQYVWLGKEVYITTGFHSNYFFFLKTTTKAKKSLWYFYYLVSGSVFQVNYEEEFLEKVILFQTSLLGIV